MGEKPNCDDLSDVNMFVKSPSKEKKQAIVTRQKEEREIKAAQEQQFKTIQRQVKQDNLQSLEQRYLLEMHEKRRKRVQSQGRILKKAWSTNTDLLDQLKSSTPDLNATEVKPKRSKRRRS